MFASGQALFYAVTQDTVIQLRAAIRKLLSVADREDAVLAAAVHTALAAAVHAALAAAMHADAALTRDDDYATLG